MTTVQQARPMDEAKIDALFGRVLDDWGGTLGSALPPEHFAVPTQAFGGFQLITSLLRAEPRIANAFRTGDGMSWSEHIARAREAAQSAGLAERVTFEVAAADAYPTLDGGYDLIAFFDCLHHMGDPVGALRHTAETLAADGTVLLVEPMAAEDVQGNLNPVGRVYSGASVLTCTPDAMASGGNVLGTLATEERLRAVASEAGLSRFRRAAETPFNRVFEARH